MTIPQDRFAFGLLADREVPHAAWHAMTADDRAIFRRRLDAANWRRALAYLATINL